LFTHGNVPYYTGADWEVNSRQPTVDRSRKKEVEKFKSSRVQEFETPLILPQHTKAKRERNVTQRTQRRGKSRSGRVKSPKIKSLRIQESWRGG
jgi:hypothetical protein